MASCDWQKIKSAGEAKAMFRHCEKEQREQAQHTNKDIDKTRTHMNMQFGVMDSGYEAICNAYDERIAELDARANANKRKDRVTLIGLSIPAPEGLTDMQSADWFCEVWRILSEQYGTDLLGGAVHFDEVHEYTDPATHEKRMSRPAMHAYVIPTVCDKLNAKQVASRSNMIALNNSVEAMSQARYGVHFMDGSKKKSRKSVEELKQESDKASVIVEAQREASKIIEEARQRADRLDAEAVEKVEKAERYAVEKRRKVSDEVENMREFAVKMSDDMKRDAQTSSEAILEDAKAEADRIRLEAEKTLKTANTSLQSAKQRDDELKQKEDELEQAKLAYQGAWDDAKGIAQGFAEEAFYKRFFGTFQEQLTGLQYRDGSTAWDRFGKYAQKAFEEAKKVTKYYNTSPMDAYTERVGERVQRADEHLRKARELPNVPYMNNGHEDTEFSL